MSFEDCEMIFGNCEKEAKAMAEVKNSFDEETFNKMFKIFNDKYPDIEIMEAIHDVCNLELFKFAKKCSYHDKDKTELNKFKPIITQLINFVFNLYTLNPNCPLFKCWKNENNEYENFQLPKNKRLFIRGVNFRITMYFIQSLYYTCSPENIKTIEFMKNKFNLFN